MLHGTTIDKVLCVFYDFVTIQDTPYSDIATVHVPKLVCVHQFCTRSKNEPDIEYCEQCGKRTDILGRRSYRDLLKYLCQPRPCANKIIANAHNANEIDFKFVLN
jgi:hypothetical protein